MSERKMIAVDLEAFKLPSVRKTRKNAETNAPKKEIRVKKPKVQSSKSIKRNLLNVIRERQEKRFQNDVAVAPDIDEFQSDFKESLDFLTEVAKRSEQLPKPNLHNHTIRRPDVLMTNMGMPMPMPKYGCLKGGKLPLYKQYTRSNREPLSIGEKVPLVQQSMVGSVVQPTVGSVVQPTVGSVVQPTVGSLQPTVGSVVQPTMGSVVQPTVGSLQPMMSSLVQSSSTGSLQPITAPIMDETKLKKAILQSTIEYKKKMAKPASQMVRRQRKTLRRTFHLGKSDKVPRVSVLISNRTIRNHISNTAQLLKQTPIHDVKKYLIKNGFIKVGSIAPNDVLRKMYETAMTACGVIHNYNPENMVYNYFATAE
jgi:hypothetical protein